MVGKQPQVQPGAERGKNNKARPMKEHQASERLSTPAADGAERRGNRHLQTDADVSANAAREACGGCLCCCHVGLQEDISASVVTHQGGGCGANLIRSIPPYLFNS